MAGTATVTESVHLEYRDGSSDKEYHIYLCDHGGLYSVHAEYGRRGKVAQRSEKGMFGSRFGARDVFSKLESEKRGKGYDSMSTARPPSSIPNGARPAATAPSAPRPAPVFDAALVAFNAKLAAYLTAMGPDELTAGRAATVRLASVAGAGKSKALAALPSYNPMVALLGAIAFASQEYTDDAVDLGTQMLSASIAGHASDVAANLLPPPLTQVLEDVLAEHPHVAGVSGLVHHLFHKSRSSWLS